jgi:hypothetical protein
MISRLWVILTIAVSTIIFTIASSQSFAAVVKAVKDNQIIIDMESDNFKPGDIVKLQDSHGKAVGLAKIKAVKGSKAKAVFKGKAENGYTVSLRSMSESSGRSSSSGRRGPPSARMWGVVVGLNSSAAKADVVETGGGTDSVSMSGSGFLLKGLLDTKLFPWLNFRGLFGITDFSVTGGTDPGCNGGSACDTKIVYLDADFLARYLFTDSIWAGVGVDLLFPLSKSATAIATSSISNTLVYDIAAGYDFHMASGSYIPIQIDYQLFPSSTTVSAHMISFSAGYVKTW